MCIFIFMHVLPCGPAYHFFEFRSVFHPWLEDLSGKLGGELKVRPSVLVAVSAAQRVVEVTFDRRVGPQVPADVRSGSKIAGTITLCFDRNSHTDRHE